MLRWKGDPCDQSERADNASASETHTHLSGRGGSVGGSPNRLHRPLSTKLDEAVFFSGAEAGEQSHRRFVCRLGHGDHRHLFGVNPGPIEGGGSDCPESAGQELERCNVGGANDGEVPPIKGGDLCDPKSLRCSHDRCVDCSQCEVAVLGNELGDPEPVTGVDRLDGKVTGREIAKKTNLRSNTQAGADQVHNLCDHKNRHHQRTGVFE